MGVGGGVSVYEAAAVSGYGHIQGQGDVSGDGAQLPKNVVHQLAAGGPSGVQAGLPGKKLLGRVVVDGQIHPGEVGQGVVREQAPGCHVHRDHRVREKILRGQESLQIGGEQGGDLRIGQDVGGLAQGAEGAAQGGGAADGVAVRADVGEDQVPVMGGQKLRRLSRGDGHASSS